MSKVNPYLTFGGNCEEAFNHYKDALGGEFSALMRFKDMPQSGQPEELGEKIMHICLPLSNGTMLMGSDSGAQYGTPVAGSNFSIALHTDSEEQTHTIFNKLAEGGKVNMPLQQVPWGAVFGMLTDKYGFDWMIDYELNQNQHNQ